MARTVNLEFVPKFSERQTRIVNSPTRASEDSQRDNQTLHEMRQRAIVLCTIVNDAFVDNDVLVFDFNDGVSAGNWGWFANQFRPVIKRLGYRALFRFNNGELYVVNNGKIGEPDRVNY